MLLSTARCYGVAEVPWYQRKVAAVIFATPPSATYDEVCVCGPVYVCVCGGFTNLSVNFGL